MPDTRRHIGPSTRKSARKASVFRRRLADRLDFCGGANSRVFFRHEFSRVGAGSFGRVAFEVTLDPGVVGDVFVVFNFL